MLIPQRASRVQRGNTTGVIKGSKVLCFLIHERSGFCNSFVGGSQAALIALRCRSALEAGRFAADSPRLSLVAGLMVALIYSALEIVGGPDRSGQRTNAIPSLDPSLHWRLGYW